MKKNSGIKHKFENEIKDRIINILLELLKTNNVEIPGPLMESLETIYGVKKNGGTDQESETTN